MYKNLLEKRAGYFYLGGIPIEINESVEPIYFDLVIAKLKNEYFDYKIVIKQEIARAYEESTQKIMVNTNEYDKALKSIYLFTEIACKTDMINNVNVNDFKDINSALNYSEELTNKKEYHLIRKNNYNGYSVHLTFEEYNYNELKDEYVKKYVK